MQQKAVAWVEEKRDERERDRDPVRCHQANELGERKELEKGEGMGLGRGNKTLSGICPKGLTWAGLVLVSADLVCERKWKLKGAHPWGAGSLSYCISRSGTLGVFKHLHCH